MKTYSVKEVREITGLTWKQLYELKEGIPGIGPMNDAGYKQYSEEDLGKLVQATLMAKLGAKPKEINKAFADENYDRNIRYGFTLASSINNIILATKYFIYLLFTICSWYIYGSFR